MLINLSHRGKATYKRAKSAQHNQWSSPQRLSWTLGILYPRGEDCLFDNAHLGKNYVRAWMDDEQRMSQQLKNFAAWASSN